MYIGDRVMRFIYSFSGLAIQYNRAQSCLTCLGLLPKTTQESCVCVCVCMQALQTAAAPVGGCTGYLILDIDVQG